MCCFNHATLSSWRPRTKNPFFSSFSGDLQVLAATKDNRLSDPFAQPKGAFPLLISVHLVFLDHCDGPMSSACHDALERRQFSGIVL